MRFFSTGSCKTARFLKLGILAALVFSLSSCDIITSLLLDALLSGGVAEDAYEFDDDAASANQLDLFLYSTTPSFGHSLTSGDQDWFVMDVPAGFITTINTVSAGGNDVDTTLTYYVDQPFSSATGFDDDGGDNTYSSLTYTNDSSTDVTLYVVVEGFSETSRGDYDLEVAVNDFFFWTNTSTGFNNAVDLGDPFTGVAFQPVSLSANDNDYYVIQTFAGDVVTVETFAVLQGIDDVDTVVDVYDYAFNFVASNDDSETGLYSQLSFTSSFNDVYYILVRGFSATSAGYYGIVVDAD